MPKHAKLKRTAYIFLGLLALPLICFFPGPVEALEEQTPATITVGGKKYVTQEHVVKKGDWISKLLRRTGVLEGRNPRELSQLLEAIKKLNKSLSNLDRIQPGQRIVILAKAPPEKSPAVEKPKTASATAPIEKQATTKKPTPTKKKTPTVKPPPETKEPLPPVPARKELKYENYTIRQGDLLSKVVLARYPTMTMRLFYNEYWGLFKKTNPSITDPNRLYWGLKIRLPLYPPQYEEGPTPQTLISQLVTDAPQDKTPGVTRPKAAPAVKPKPRPASLKKETPPAAKASEPVKPKPAPVIVEVIEPTPSQKNLTPAGAAQTPDDVAKKDPGKPMKKINPAVYHLGRIFSEMGEVWVQSGEHFIPLKSGSGVHFKATTFPMVNPQKSRWVIVDPSNTFPEKLAKLIGSTWDHYRVVHLTQKDDLSSSLGKVLKASGYHKVFKKGEPLEMKSDIGLRITGDWIVTLADPGPGEDPAFVLINLTESHKPRTPETIKKYLAEVGVKAIEYPPARGQAPAESPRIDKTEAGPDPTSLIGTVLTLLGHSFSAQTKIPVYQDREGDLRFVVTADYYFRIKGKDAFIDLTGISPEIKSYLNDQGLLFLDLTAVNSPVDMVVRTLKFCGVTYDPGPHAFTATPGDKSKNVGIIISGVVFSGRAGKKVLATQRYLSDNLVAFLTQKGYTYLALPPRKSPLQVKATVLPSTREASEADSQ